LPGTRYQRQLPAPFITYWDYGVGDSLSVLAHHAPQARQLWPSTLECHQERRTLVAVDQWLGRLGLASLPMEPEGKKRQLQQRGVSIMIGAAPISKGHE